MNEMNESSGAHVSGSHRSGAHGLGTTDGEPMGREPMDQGDYGSGAIDTPMDRVDHGSGSHRSGTMFSMLLKTLQQGIIASDEMLINFHCKRA